MNALLAQCSKQDVDHGLVQSRSYDTDDILAKLERLKEKATRHLRLIFLDVHGSLCKLLENDVQVLAFMTFMSSVLFLTHALDISRRKSKTLSTEYDFCCTSTKCDCGM